MVSVQRARHTDLVGGSLRAVQLLVGLLGIVVAVQNRFANGLPDGAPSCSSLIPHHKQYSPQPSHSPYEITVSNVSVAAGQSIVVTVSAPDATLSTVNFAGFHLRAVSDSSGEVIGNFVVDATTASMFHALSCGAATPEGAITHNNPDNKTSVRATWIAPADVSEPTTVTFTATVAQQFSTFWVNIKSVPVAVSAGGGGGSTTEAPTSDIYDGCGTTKSCFGLPGGDKCIGTSNCRILATFVRRHSSDLIDFELMGAVSDSSSYVALGFSTDSLMGSDSVRECVIKTGDISGSESFNRPGSPKSNVIIRSMELTGKSYENGALVCKFSLLSQFVTNNNMSFDLFKNNYYVLLALGQFDNRGDELVQHTERLASENAFNFTAIETGRSASINTLIAIHGCLMVVSWIGTVSVAIFMARYYKQMWPERTFCKVRVWFAMHRSLNMITVLLSSAAFVIIFIHVNGFSSEWPANPHPVTGIITFGLMLLQPIMALFRCDPGSSRRPIFNWLHFLVGMVAVILAVVTMFYAVTLHAVDLPQYFWWILIAYVAFFVIAFANMEFFTCIAARDGDKESIAMQNYPGSGGATGSPSRGALPPSFDDGQARFKQVMLILFVAGAIGFSAALVAVIATS